MPETQNSRPSVLIIDDERQIQTILSEALKLNYDCTTASSAEEGLELLRQKEFALVISDINMNGITGLEMTPQILAAAPDTVVIIMSGEQNIESAITALRVGAFDYLVKPFDLRLVAAAVRRGADYYQLRLNQRQYESQLEMKVHERTNELLQATIK